MSVIGQVKVSAAHSSHLKVMALGSNSNGDRFKGICNSLIATDSGVYDSAHLLMLDVSGTSKQVYKQVSVKPRHDNTYFRYFLSHPNP